jgi:hypothetical protein
MRRGGILFALILALFACHDDDKTVAPTGPGVLDVILTSPNNDDGAVLLTIDGAIDSVQVLRTSSSPPHRGRGHESW